MTPAATLPPDDKKGSSNLAKAPRRSLQPLQLDTKDPDFLPAALEILQTPPPSLVTLFIMLICGGFVFALLFSYFGRLDINVVAPGKIQYSGLSKVVQPLEPGKVVAVFVENGKKVSDGDLLVELDATETSADREAKMRDLESASAEVDRRAVAIDLARRKSFRPQPIEFAPGVDAIVRRREANVLAADIGKLGSTVANLNAQLAEKVATKERLALSIAAREKSIALATERVKMRQNLENSGTGSRETVIEAMLEYENQKTAQVGDQSRLLESDAAARSLEDKIEETISEFVADQTQKLAEAKQKQDRLKQEIIKAQSKYDRTRLTAPISGTVQQLNITTVGQVVNSGQSLMTIVPVSGPVEIEAMVASQDIGFIEQGQHVVTKIEAFPFTRYGTLGGTVTKLSRDAVDEWESSNLSDAENAAKLRSPQGSQLPHAQNLAFPTTISLTRQTINIGGNEVELKPGMAVTAEIRTGRRRIIDYLFSPIRSGSTQTASNGDNRKD